MEMLLAIIGVLFMGSTCKKENEHCHKTITIVNNSEGPIYVECNYYYPDTLYFGHFSSPILDSVNTKIWEKTAGDSPLYRDRSCWEDIFTNGLIPSDTLMIYIFDADIIENVEWSSVIHYYMVSKRYDLSLQDLQKMDWEITYP